ncbi:MAG: AAA domain-containing protein [Cetobacterium sp.]
MEFEKIRYFKDEKILDIKFVNDKVKLKIGSLVEFFKIGKNYYLKLDQNEKLDLDNNTEAYIDSLIGGAYIAVLKDNSTVRVLTYSRSEENMNLPILLNEDYLKNKNLKNKNLKNIIVNLEKNYILKKDKNTSYALLGIKKDLDEKNELVLLGEKDFLIFEKTKKDYYKDGKKIETEAYVVSGHNKDYKTEEYRFFLIAGKIDFLNDSENYRNDMETNLRLEELKNDSSAYLNIWNKYAAVEKEFSMKKVQEKKYYKVIEATYQKISDKKEVFQLILNKKSDFKEGENLRVVDKEPQVLFQDYTAEAEKEFLCESSIDLNLVVTKDSKSSKNLTVDYNEKLDESKLKDTYIFYSLKGDDAVHSRRERARNLILNDEAAMKGLSLIIEGKKLRKEKAKNYNALSIQTKRSLFPKYDPTETQLKAIEVALNTPDIALIQGPPGTGKTTVITAILQRLSEEKKEVGNISGSNLITSFQHDAVTNATSRIKILGLPAEKYGQKKGTDGEVLNSVFKKYINETLNSYYEENPELKRRKDVEELRELYHEYDENLRKTPEKNEVKMFLKKVKKFTKDYLISSEVTHEIKRLEDEISSVNKEYSFIEKRYFSKLPTSFKKLEDNGMFFVEKSIETLENGIQIGEIIKENFEKELNFLKYFLRTEIYDFELMKRCKISIISKFFTVEDSYLSELENQKVEDLLNTLKLFVEELKSESKDYKEDLKIKYLKELENNPLRIRDTLRSYITTFGATCQQSQGKVIKRAKNMNEKLQSDRSIALKDYEIYDNVLVDEAARSGPPDLLIPMSMAKDRIILVGDHKQLPHIVDESIVDEIGEEEDKSVKIKAKEKLTLSMFEFLIKKCEELEKLDGIKRVVMLDKQYRMHPKMGDFVSNHFYEGKLESGLKAEHFKTTLKGLEGKAFAWMDLPYRHDNSEVKRGSSTYRTIEAREIAKFIYKHIDTDEAKGKNFGIITFYAEQREEIFKELASSENRFSQDQDVIVEKTKDGYKIIDKYIFSDEKGIDEKLRIGSVDAFQGMEFNYVCLSMVRSNNIQLSSEKDVRKKFGFLINPNRLCVSMSRQKELIVMFGDSKMFENANYEDLEPLKTYLEMCKEGGEHGYFKSIL